MLTEELFGDGRAFLPVVGWMLTYVLHSSLLLVAAWAVAKWWGVDRPWLGDVVWKTALVAGLLTATIHALVPWQPAGRWSLNPPATSSALFLGAALPEVEPTVLERASPVGAPTARVTSMSVESQPHGRTIFHVAPWLVVTWWAGGLVMALALARRGLWLWRRLADRRDLDDVGVRAMVDDLSRSAELEKRVRVTVSDRISVPIALGLFRPEICLPRRCLERLSVSERRALLAHEVAHLARRDPAWSWIAAGVEAVFFFQPLNRLAGRRLRRVSELICDDWAVRRTGSAASLARCLTEVASWSIERRGFFPSPGIAGGESELGQRVERLIAGQRRRTGGIPRGWLLAPSLAFWGLVGMLAPGWNADSTVTPQEVAEPPAFWQAADTASAGTVDTGTEVESDVPLTRSWQREPLVDALRDLASVRDLNFVIEPGVSGYVTAEVDGVPWSLLLESVLKINNLAMTSEGEVVRIFPRVPTVDSEVGQMSVDAPVSAAVSEPESEESQVEEGAESSASGRDESPLAEEVLAAGAGSEAVSEVAGTAVEERSEEGGTELDGPVEELDGPVEETVGPVEELDGPVEENAGLVEETSEAEEGDVGDPLETVEPDEVAMADEIEPNAVVPPKLEELSPPRFPRMAIRLNKWRATVTLAVEVDETGQVTAARVVGEEVGFGFDRSAIRSAMKSRYEPARRDGEPVAAETELVVSFVHRR